MTATRVWSYPADGGPPIDVTDGGPDDTAVGFSARGWLQTAMQCSACSVVIQAVVPIRSEEQLAAIQEWDEAGPAPECFDSENCPTCGESHSMECVVLERKGGDGQATEIAPGDAPVDAVTAPVFAPPPGALAMGVTDSAIAELRAEYEGLEATDRVTHKAVVEAHRAVKGLRSRVEAKRKELKAPALDWGRRVDAEAKRITGALLEIESPLGRTRNAYEAAEAERKRKAEEEARALQRWRTAKIDEWGDMVVEHSRPGTDPAKIESALDALRTETVTVEVFGEHLLPRARVAHGRSMALLSQSLGDARKEAEAARERAERDAREAEQRAAADARARDAEREAAELRAKLAELEGRQVARDGATGDPAPEVVMPVHMGDPSVTKTVELDDSLPAPSLETMRELSTRDDIRIVDAGPPERAEAETAGAAVAGTEAEADVGWQAEFDGVAVHVGPDRIEVRAMRQVFIIDTPDERASGGRDEAVAEAWREMGTRISGYLRGMFEAHKDRIW